MLITFIITIVIMVIIILFHYLFYIQYNWRKLSRHILLALCLPDAKGVFEVQIYHITLTPSAHKFSKWS